ncbi:MAG: hypothetical protein JO307_26100 [Bryobacterales bacterium]|nr:hypothetical protein [Bryobacterales bacterium]
MSQKRKRFEADGYPDPRCVICGDPSLNGMERDHLAGAANSDLVEPLCANHHAIKSHEAENGPMAPLRRRNPHRSALVRQAAFDYGLAAILGMMAIADQSQNATRAVFLGIVALALIGWASWDLIADAHFTKVLGPDYDAAIAAEAPR